MEKPFRPADISIPPAYWREKELRRLGVEVHRKVPPSDLAGKPHEIFDKERWGAIEKSRFDAMQQSFLLASYLLEAGLPYLASFLPKPTFSDDSQGNRFIQIKKAVSQKEIQLVHDELEEIMIGLEWVEDGQMFKRKGWFGLTSQAYPRPDSPDDHAGNLIYWDRRCRLDGFDRRQNTIFIAKEYADTLLNTPKNTQEHITATFHLAVTLVHEIGHLVYWQDYNNKVKPDEGFVEPFVAGQSRMGLGLAFTSWIFGGWNPHPICLTRHSRGTFKNGMCWGKQLASPESDAFDLLDRPSWEIQYSMPFKHLQNIMRQKTWDDISGEADKFGATRSFLPPETPFRSGRHSRLAYCKKLRVRLRWRWRHELSPSFRFKSLVEGDGVEKPRISKLAENIASPVFHDPYWNVEPLSPEAIEYEDGHEVESEGAFLNEHIDEFSDEYTDEYTDGFLDESDQVENVDPRKEGDEGVEVGAHSKKLKMEVSYTGIYDYRKTQISSLAGGRGLWGHENYPLSEFWRKAIQNESKRTLTEADFMDYPEKALRNFCHVQGLSSNGTKKALAQRLENLERQRQPFTTDEPVINPFRYTRLTYDVRVKISQKSTGNLLYMHIAKLMGIPVRFLELHMHGNWHAKPRVLNHNDVLMALDSKALSRLRVYGDIPEEEADPRVPRMIIPRLSPEP